MAKVTKPLNVKDLFSRLPQKRKRKSKGGNFVVVEKELSPLYVLNDSDEEAPLYVLNDSDEQAPLHVLA